MDKVAESKDSFQKIYNANLSQRSIDTSVEQKSLFQGHEQTNKMFQLDNSNFTQNSQISFLPNTLQPNPNLNPYMVIPIPIFMPINSMQQIVYAQPNPQSFTENQGNKNLPYKNYQQANSQSPFQNQMQILFQQPQFIDQQQMLLNQLFGSQQILMNPLVSGFGSNPYLNFPTSNNQIFSPGQENQDNQFGIYRNQNGNHISNPDQQNLQKNNDQINNCKPNFLKQENESNPSTIDNTPVENLDQQLKRKYNKKQKKQANFEGVQEKIEKKIKVSLTENHQIPKNFYNFNKVIQQNEENIENSENSTIKSPNYSNLKRENLDNELDQNDDLMLYSRRENWISTYVQNLEQIKVLLEGRQSNEIFLIPNENQEVSQNFTERVNHSITQMTVQDLLKQDKAMFHNQSKLYFNYMLKQILRYISLLNMPALLMSKIQGIVLNIKNSGRRLDTKQVRKTDFYNHSHYNVCFLTINQSSVKKLKQRDFELHKQVFGIELEEFTENWDNNNQEILSINFFKKCLFEIYRRYFFVSNCEIKKQYHSRAVRGIELMINGKFVQRF